jgi:predicted nucleic acid-binding protein
LILDTSSVISRVKKGVEIWENITVVSLIEYPPILDYENFHGEIYFPTRAEQLRAVHLQKRLRVIGKPLGASDLLIAAVCLNRNEELVTMDEDFLVIREVEPSFKMILEKFV